MSLSEDQAVALLGRMLGAEPLGPVGGAVDEEAGGRGAEEQYADWEGAGRHHEHRDNAGQARQGRPAPRMPAYRPNPHVRSLPGSAVGYTSEPGLLDRVRRPSYRRWLAEAQAAGGCVRPVRLRPSMLRADPTTGELEPAAGELPDAPDGVIYKACGDRRASVCPPCAERYRADTWQLIAAGLGGGQGVPLEVVGHPRCS